MPGVWTSQADYHIFTIYRHALIKSKRESRIGSLTTDSPPTCFFRHSESVWPVIQVSQTLGQVRLDGDAVQWEDMIVHSDMKDRVDDNVASACLLRVSGDKKEKTFITTDQCCSSDGTYRDQDLV